MSYISALRELFRAKLEKFPASDFSSGELAKITVHQNEDDRKVDEVDKVPPSEHASLGGLNDAADEFFDVPEPSDNELTENGWGYDYGSEMYSQVQTVTLFNYI